MANKNFLKMVSKVFCIIGMALIIAIIIGCDDGSTTPNTNPVEKEVQELPSFEGSFVASEQEAMMLASQAQTQIDLAIQEAVSLGQLQTSQNLARAVEADGTYSYNGITVTYSYNTTGDSYPQIYPYLVNMVYNATIDGTYGGYRINGRYDFRLDVDFTSAASFTYKYIYDCVFTVSYNGQGMKLVQTGDMTVSSSEGYSYNLHYAVYDNNNVRRYNYDYNL